MSSIVEILKRNKTLFAAVHAAKGLVRTNVEIIDKLSALAPNSAGSVKARAGLALEAGNQIFALLSDLIYVSGKPLTRPRSIEEISRDTRDSDALEALFNKYGSDKSARHDYHKLYSSILGPRRNENLCLLEIGLGTTDPSVVSNMGKHGKPGASLRAFRDYLPNAQIFGADIDRKNSLSGRKDKDVLR